MADPGEGPSPPAEGGDGIVSAHAYAKCMGGDPANLTFTVNGRVLAAARDETRSAAASSASGSGRASRS